MEGVSQGFLLHLSRFMVFPFTQTVYLANEITTAEYWTRGNPIPRMRETRSMHMLCEYVILPVRAQPALRSF